MLQSAEHDQQPVQGYQRVSKSSETTGIKTGGVSKAADSSGPATND